MAEEYKLIPKSWLMQLADILRETYGISGNITRSEMIDRFTELAMGGVTVDNTVLTSLIDRSITEIEIPAGVTKIGRSAFEYCVYLKQIAIPEGVTTIYSNAFSYCSNLAQITLPESLETISSQILGNTPKLQQVVLPTHITDIPQNLLINSGIVKFIAKGKIVTVNAYAFSGCGKCLTYDFTACRSVPRLTQTTAFNGINADCKIYVPASLYDKWIVATNWAQYADHIVAVGGDSEGLSMTLSSDGTHYRVTGMGICTDTELIIPSEYNGLPVSYIGDSAFYNNKDITKVVFGKNIAGFGYFPFWGCTNCTVYDFSKAQQIPTMEMQSGFDENEELVMWPCFGPVSELPEGTRIIVPASLYDAWITETNWCWYADFIVSAE